MARRIIVAGARILFLACAVCGFLGISFFVLHGFGLFQVESMVDADAELFSLTAGEVPETLEKITKQTTDGEDETKTLTNTLPSMFQIPRAFLCKLLVIENVYPETAERIYFVYNNLSQTVFAERMITALAIRHKDLQKDFSLCDSGGIPAQVPLHATDNGEAYPWIHSEEWQVLRTALVRDREAIMQAAQTLHISPRILVGPIIGEQLRFYTSARSTFKQYLQPAQSFIYMSKFSYGIAGMKPTTAERIELALTNPTSPFYLGPEYEKILEYPEDVLDTNAERMRRIDNKEDHSWIYLYVGLYLKQFQAQWKKAGYPIDDRPDVLATLYNLGPNKSNPKEYPEAGGAPIVIDGVSYTFGGLAYDFYWSGELLDVFPYSLEDSSF